MIKLKAMSRKLLFLAICFLLSCAVFSQTLQILDAAGNNITNQSYTIAGLSTDGELYVDYGEIDVQNTGNKTIDVGCRRYELNVGNNTSNYYCWSFCYSPMGAGTQPVHNDLGTVDVAAGATDTASFKAAHKPAGFSGTSTYRFVFYNSADLNDSAYLDVVFDVAVGIEEQLVAGRLNVFPNPANSTATFDFNLSQTQADASIVIYDVLGKMVDEIILSKQADQINHSLKQFQPGVYFYGLKIEGVIRLTKKLIVAR